MKQLLAPILAMSPAFVANATESNASSAELIEALHKVDKEYFCIYNNTLYSEGALLSMAETVKQCRRKNGTTSLILYWLEPR